MKLLDKFRKDETVDFEDFWWNNSQNLIKFYLLLLYL